MRCKSDRALRGFRVWQFLQDTGGAHAVEFAIVFPVFVLLACVAIEVGLVLFTQSNLNYAARDAARLIRTGQIQSGGGESAFTSKICSDTNSALITCSKLQYNVQSGNSFDALDPSVQTDRNGNMANTQFSPGGPSSNVLVQVGYPLPCLVPLACNYIGSHGTLLLVSTIAFENENY
jgi:Flp pilus assembly protein TadG